jgi:hypothetical protein
MNMDSEVEHSQPEKALVCPVPKVYRDPPTGSNPIIKGRDS